MHLYEGKIYNDDRLFILDLTMAEKGNQTVWAVVTRRNHEGFPPFRVDDFETKEAAVEYIKKIEPATPCILFGGKSPEKPLCYDEYCQKLKTQGIPSAMEIYELNKDKKRSIVVDDEIV